MDDVLTPAQFVSAVWRHRTSAIIRTDDRDTAGLAMDAAVRGGIRIVEFTLTTPGALDLIRAFKARRSLPVIDGLDRLIVGAGTVLCEAQARAAVSAGASFLVSPLADPEVIRVGAELGVVVIPGVQTPTEMWAAHRLGAPLLKLFPAPSRGPVYLAAALGPMPFLRVIPTSGVDEDNLAAWLGVGAWGVGLVGPLFRVADLRARAWNAIESRAARMRARAMAVERGPEPIPMDPTVAAPAT